MPAKKKVFVSGCFDLLHSGHITFLSEAAKHGEVIVGIGSDETVNYLKGRYPVNNEVERKYMLESLRSVSKVIVNTGNGLLDFEPELRTTKPDILIVNEDGNNPAKEKLCNELNIEYKVLQRVPGNGMPTRSTTSLRDKCNIPFRVDLAGGWHDHPFVSEHFPGAVITISIEPTIEFNDRSGMASSTRRKAQELWGNSIPAGDKIHLAKVLFGYENPPGTTQVSGSQDSLGIILPGLNYLYYDGAYWPQKIESVRDSDIIDFLESHLSLLNLGPRGKEVHVLEKINSSEANSERLAKATDRCWHAIKSKDLTGFGESVTEAFDTQVEILPAMMNNDLQQVIAKYREVSLGCKLSGAGGGGYLVLVSDKKIPGTIPIKIRRENFF